MLQNPAIESTDVLETIRFEQLLHQKYRELLGDPEKNSSALLSLLFIHWYSALKAKNILHDGFWFALQELQEEMHVFWDEEFDIEEGWSLTLSMFAICKH